MNTFMRAIIEKRERPPIPDDCIPSLRELIEACWAHEPSTSATTVYDRRMYRTVVVAPRFFGLQSLD
jgi:hypothetical protein